MSLEDRLTDIKSRLGRIENRLGLSERPTPSPSASSREPDEPASSFELSSPESPTTSAAPDVVGEGRGMGELITHALGWAGAAALVLAASYLIRLAIDSGWLTPSRQVGLAVSSGLILIGAGLTLRDRNPRYASLLPAGGVVILFLSVYGAHLYYALISATVATGAVVLICLLSLWLCREFLVDLYALFAVVGSYSAPLLLPSLRGSVTDLVIYFACWSVIFGFFALWIRKRGVYLLASYLALIVFYMVWSRTAPSDWIAALVFQTVHLVIFGVAAAAFSIRERTPMDQPKALQHLPPLLIFYFLQYHVLERHIHSYAPWIAMGSVLFLIVCYLVTKTVMRERLPGSHLLISSYAALVLFHAGYLESVPLRWAPWVAFVVLPAVAVYGRLRRNPMALGMPIWAAVGLIFVANYLRLVVRADAGEIFAYDWLTVLYPAQLYLAYYLLRRERVLKGFHFAFLISGHIGAMAAAVHLFDSRFVVSLLWGSLALACLLLALSRRNKGLGQSSLLVFAASIGKGLIYDLSLAAPVVRIGSLVVLGITLYIGGWLYQKVNALEDDA
jgi:uncharacterized membrane protein